MVASQAPPTARCPQCHQERPRAELFHKHHRLTCCTACYQVRRLAKRHRWEERHRARRTKQRRQGGVPCPPYVAWTATDQGREVWLVVPDDDTRAAAYALTGYGGCSCGQAGCVHLVVACLAQQGGEGV